MLPAAARKTLGIKAGSHVRLDVRDGEIVIRPIRTVLDVSGILRDAAQGKPTDWQDQLQAAMDGVVKEYLNEEKD